MILTGSPAFFSRRFCWRTILAAVLVGACLFAGAEQAPPDQETPDDIDIERIFTELLLSTALNRLPAEPYDPGCDEDAGCRVWKTFRERYPFPHQTFAYDRLEDGRSVLIVSEPPPVLDRQVLIAVLDELFADTKAEITTRKWMIGEDGWLEDIVVSYTPPFVFQRQDLDPLLLDAVTFLNDQLFNTIDYTYVEEISTYDRFQEKPAPDIHPTGADVKDWLTDRQLRWSTAASDYEVRSSGLLGSRGAEVFYSDDGLLVALVFPIADLKVPEQLVDHPLRAAFREFSVRSDTILSGVWDDKGQVLILGRARASSLQDSPPLRFETFMLISQQASDELHQSYERNHVFAGKLTDGPHSYRDWAPILLSDPLIDTEFGALLNITDQMLKAWSLAGEVEYLYFDYPRSPDIYPFSGQPLDQLVYEATGSLQVLFNWNTAGSGMLFQDGDESYVVVNRTSALPITYGSDLGDGSQLTTGHLTKFEDEAYNYFSSLGDPNLSRVVQYTLLYQMMQAISPGKTPLPGVSRKDVREISPRIDAHRYMSNRLAQLFASDALPDHLKHLLEDIKRETSAPTSTIANFLGNPREGTLNALFPSAEKQRADYEKRVKRYNRRVDALDIIIDRHNALARSYNQTLSYSYETEQALQRSSKAIEEETAALSTELEALESYRGPEALIQRNLTRIEELTTGVREYVGSEIGFEEFRVPYVAANRSEPKGWIKTPSIVVSWSTSTILSVGGHNLDSRTLAFRYDPSQRGMRLVESEKGPQLVYGRDMRRQVRENSSELARAVEHKGVTKASELAQIARTPKSKGSTKDVLKFPDVTEPKMVKTPEGRNFRSKEEAIGQLREIANHDNCCLFVMKSKDGLVAAENVAKGSSRVTELKDNLVLTSEVARSRQNNKQVIFFGYTTPQAQALLASQFSGRSSVVQQAKALRTSISDVESVTYMVSAGGGGGRNFVTGRRAASFGEPDAGGGFWGPKSNRNLLTFWREAKDVRNMPIEGSRAQVKTLKTSDAEARFAQKLKWDTQRDGELVVTEVDFRMNTNNIVLDVAAGTLGSKRSTADRIKQIVTTVARDAKNRNVGHVIDAIKAQLKSLQGDSIKRLEIETDRGSSLDQPILFSASIKEKENG